MAIAAELDPLGFLRHTAELMRVYDPFLARLVEMSDYDGAKNQERMASIVAAPLADAQRQGVLHADLTPGNVLVACRMLASHWRLDEQPDFARAFERRLALLTRGLLARRQPSSQRRRPHQSRRAAAHALRMAHDPSPSG